jgi:hypothetical protein
MKLHTNAGAIANVLSFNCMIENNPERKKEHNEDLMVGAILQSYSDNSTQPAIDFSIFFNALHIIMWSVIN